MAQVYEKGQVGIAHRSEIVCTKNDVFNRLQKHQQEIRQLGVNQCGVFGSFAKNTAISDESDVDILVVFEPDQKTFDNFMSLSFLLEEMFGRNVDLVTMEALSPHIGPHILDEVEYVAFDS